jgi:coatomer subunit alpha
LDRVSSVISRKKDIQRYFLHNLALIQIALQFVQEPQTRFELAIECGNLAVAVETARALDNPALWNALGQAALAQGNIQIVELAFQKLKNFEKLSFLYLITGDSAKLERMGKIAEHRGDYGSEFQNSLWTGNVEARIRVFKELDLCTIDPD